MKGQLSAEMLILLVLILAMVALAFSYIQGYVAAQGTHISDLSNPGKPCSDQSQCASDSLTCENSVCTPIHQKAG